MPPPATGFPDASTAPPPEGAARRKSAVMMRPVGHWHAGFWFRHRWHPGYWGF